MTLRLGPAAIERLAGGPVAISIKVSGLTLAHRTVTLRAGGEIGA